MIGVVIGLLVAVGVVVALLWVFQRGLIYFPSSQPAPPVEAYFALGQEAALATDDGLELSAWFLPPVGGRSLATVIVFNGNAGGRELRAPLAAALTRKGLGVLLLDYRGYAGNPGSPSEDGLLADARAARAYLLSRADVDPARLVYFGESLGAAVAVALAAEHPPAALILRSPFTSLADIAAVHYPFLPAGLMLRDRYESIERIGRVRAPLLVVAGQRDRIVPMEQSRRLFAAASGPKRFHPVADADHNDAALLAGADMVNAMIDFVAQAVEPRT